MTTEIHDKANSLKKDIDRRQAELRELESGREYKIVFDISSHITALSVEAKSAIEKIMKDDLSVQITKLDNEYKNL